MITLIIIVIINIDIYLVAGHRRDDLAPVAGDRQVVGRLRGRRRLLIIYIYIYIHIYTYVYIYIYIHIYIYIYNYIYRERERYIHICMSNDMLSIMDDMYVHML